MIWYLRFRAQEGKQPGIHHERLNHLRELAVEIGQRLGDSGLTLATAESCSGGLVANTLTDVAGSSAYFLGGVVAYSNAVKETMLGVDSETLKEHGAVSEPVARQMAEGARKRFGADYAVACTGIAGPSGGSPDKPVGLVYTAVATPDHVEVRRNLFNGLREEIKRMTAQTVLQMLIENLEGIRSQENSRK